MTMWGLCMENRNLRDSFYFAIRGIIYVILTQRNMRIHLLLALITVILGINLEIDVFSLLLVILAIFLVLITEMINTAVESTVDLYTRQQKQLAAIAKDVSAGAVLLASINAVVLGYTVFFTKLNSFMLEFMQNALDVLTLSYAVLLLISSGIFIGIAIIVQLKGSNFNILQAIVDILAGVIFVLLFLFSEHSILAIIVALTWKYTVVYIFSLSGLGATNILMILSGLIIGKLSFWVW